MASICHSALLHDKLVDDGLDVVDAAYQSFQRVRFGPRADATLHPHPSAPTLDPNARFGKPAIGQDGLLDARNYFLVVEVGVWKATAAGQITTRSTLGAYMSLRAHFGLGDQGLLLRRAVRNCAGHLKERIVEIVCTLFGGHCSSAGSERKGREADGYDAGSNHRLRIRPSSEPSADRRCGSLPGMGSK